MKRRKITITPADMGYSHQGPRYIHLGHFSGEDFNNKVLIPILEKNSDSFKLILDFRGTNVYSPSFLDAVAELFFIKGRYDILRRLKIVKISREWRDFFNDRFKYHLKQYGKKPWRRFTYKEIIEYLGHQVTIEGKTGIYSLYTISIFDNEGKIEYTVGFESGKGDNRKVETLSSVEAFRRVAFIKGEQRIFGKRK